MSKASELREKYEADLQLLQIRCTHENTGIFPYYWAPGHSNGTCKYCKECEAILEHYPDYPNIDFTVTSTDI
jgi:hypothetical protein